MQEAGGAGGGGGGWSSSSGSRRAERDIVSASRWDEEEDNDERDLLASVVNGTLAVAGDIDLNTAEAFQTRAVEYISGIAEPRLDLSRVEFVDSAGLAALLALARLAKRENKTLRLLVRGNPRRVLQITGIERMLVLED